MSDFSHDAAEDGFHEIQLSGKQVVFLFMVLTVASAVIFLTGVLVGRSVRTQRVEAMDTSAAAATSSPAQAADAAPPTTEPPPAASEVPDELSYHKRLQGETPPPDQMKPEAKQEPPPAQPAAAAPATAAPPSPSPAAAQPPAAPPAAPATPTAKPGAWVVQVGAFGNAVAARDVVKQLSTKGYPAFLVSPAPGMPAIFRVQVGGYPNRSEADQVARRIEKEDQFKPVVRQNR